MTSHLINIPLPASHATKTTLEIFMLGNTSNKTFNIHYLYATNTFMSTAPLSVCLLEVCQRPHILKWLCNLRDRHVRRVAYFRTHSLKPPAHKLLIAIVPKCSAK